MKADEFPEQVAWKQGMGYYVANIDTGEKTFTFENPGVPDLKGKGTAPETFRVLRTDKDPPSDRKLKMGAVDAVVGKRIAYRGKRSKAKHKKGKR